MTKIAIVGNLTADPELRFINSGAAVASFTIADTPRVYDKTSGEFKDGETTFWRCSLWREAGENAAESLTRGTRVVAIGETKTRSYEANGEKRSVVEVTVDEIGPSLRYATASVTKTNRGGAKPAAGGWPETNTEDAPF